MTAFEAATVYPRLLVFFFNGGAGGRGAGGAVVGRARRWRPSLVVLSGCCWRLVASARR